MDTAQDPALPGERAVAPGQCGLNAFEDCANPLPEPATGPDGKRRGGQPAQYCSPRHRDRAAYLRRKAAASATDAAVLHAEQLAARLGPLLEALTTQLAIIGDGALRRAALAEQHAERADRAAAIARQDTADARVRARTAEQESSAATGAAKAARARERAADRRAVVAEQRAAGALAAERALHARQAETVGALRAAQAVLQRITQELQRVTAERDGLAREAGRQRERAEAALAEVTRASAVRRRLQRAEAERDRYRAQAGRAARVIARLRGDRAGGSADQESS
jgi:hypothetical protein